MKTNYDLVMNELKNYNKNKNIYKNIYENKNQKILYVDENIVMKI